MKMYRGVRYGNGNAEVSVEDTTIRPTKRMLLNPRLDLANHSPDGFEWGYNGNGPAQLALALLADALQSDERAKKLYQDFKNRVIARLPRDEAWTTSEDEIKQIAGVIETERKAQQ